jgi:hypothetical protein
MTIRIIHSLQATEPRMFAVELCQDYNATTGATRWEQSRGVATENFNHRIARKGETNFRTRHPLHPQSYFLYILGSAALIGASAAYIAV